MGFPATFMRTFGCVCVWGRRRFPRPATGMIAFMPASLALAEEGHQPALHFGRHFIDVLDRVHSSPVRTGLIGPERPRLSERGERGELVIATLGQVLPDRGG